MRKSILLLFILWVPIVNAVGISPAITRLDFEPNLERTITFYTQKADLDVYIEGSLSQYLTVTENRIKEEGYFVVQLKMPEYVDNPGDNYGYIGLIEKTDNGGTVAGIASIRSPIIVKIPYEGIYASIQFRVHNLNINETGHFSVIIDNLGKEDITATAAIDILGSNNKVVEKFSTEEKMITSKTKHSFDMVFDASKHVAGNYNATAEVTYAGLSKHFSDTFRIGTLDISILDFSKSFTRGKIGRFNIDIQSNWNSEISNVYANVLISNDTGEVSSFKTTSTDLKPWEVASLSTYWDLGDLGIGDYSAKILVIYEDKSTSAEGVVSIMPAEEETKNYFTTVNVLIAVILALIILHVIIWIRRKK